jgi:hypothetical protein
MNVWLMLLIILQDYDNTYNDLDITLINVTLPTCFYLLL